MAFICTLNSDWDVTATLLTLEQGNGEYICRVPVGFDDSDNSVISTWVCLATNPGFGPLQYELTFEVVISDPNGDLDFRSDGHETIRIIPEKRDRELVLKTICFATERLIDEVKPLEVTMTTHEANLPEKALRKYDRIASIFHSAGYKAGRGDPIYGMNIWMMTKLAV